MVSNYIGEMLKESSKRFKNIVLAGHPGKLAKILQGDYYTHSKSSRSALPLVKNRASALWRTGQENPNIEEITTVEGVVHALESSERERLFNQLAEEIESAVNGYLGHLSLAGVVLVDMHSDIIGKGKQISIWEADECLRSAS